MTNIDSLYRVNSMLVLPSKKRFRFSNCLYPAPIEYSFTTDSSITRGMPCRLFCKFYNFSRSTSEGGVPQWRKSRKLKSLQGGSKFEIFKELRTVLIRAFFLISFSKSTDKMLHIWFTQIGNLLEDFSGVLTFLVLDSLPRSKGLWLCGSSDLMPSPLAGRRLGYFKRLRIV